MYSTIQFTIHAKGYVILEKNNLRTAQEWTKSYFELTAPHVHPKAGNHLRSHLRAIMALDHRRLIRPEKKIRPNFFAFDMFTLQNLANKSGYAGVNHPFMPLYITSEVKQCHEALFLSYRMQYFIILQYKLHSFNIQDDRSTRGFLAKPLKIYQITYTASRFSR